MRSVVLSLALPLLLLACSSSSNQAASDADGSTPAPSDDASAAGCTNLGGMCVPYTTTCPLPQQNATLCGDTVMLCCLPSASAPPMPTATPDSGIAPGPDASPAAEAAAPPVDASSAPNG